MRTRASASERGSRECDKHSKPLPVVNELQAVKVRCVRACFKYVWLEIVHLFKAVVFIKFSRFARAGLLALKPLACLSGGRAGAAGYRRPFGETRRCEPQLGGGSWLYGSSGCWPRPHDASYVTPAAPTPAATRAPATAVRGPKQRRRSCLWWCRSRRGGYGCSPRGGESATTSTGEFVAVCRTASLCRTVSAAPRCFAGAGSPHERQKTCP